MAPLRKYIAARYFVFFAFPHWHAMWIQFFCINVHQKNETEHIYTFNSTTYYITGLYQLSTSNVLEAGHFVIYIQFFYAASRQTQIVS